MKFLMIFALGLLTGVLSGCSAAKPQAKQEDSIPKRSSGKISRALAIKRYRDFAPVLSSDGKKLAFLSGRDQNTIRAYLFTNSDSNDEDAKPVAILGEEDFGEELEVELSGDASIAGIVYFKDGQHDLVVKFLDAAGKVAQITSNTEVEGSPSISPDAKLLAFASGSLRGGVKTRLYVATISKDSQEIGTPVQIESINAFSFGPVWSKSENALFIGRPSKQTGAIELQKISFSDPSQPSSNTVADLGLKFSTETLVKPDRESRLQVSDTKLYLTQMVSPTERAQSSHIGNHETFNQQFPRDRRLISVLTADQGSQAAGTAAKIDPLGFSVQSFGVSKGGTVASSVRQFLICKGQESGKFVQGIQIIDDSASATNMIGIVPYYDKESAGWKASQDYCPSVEPVAEGSEPKPVTNFPDHYIREVAINADATKSKITLAYTSHFYFGKQSDEGVVLGDPEVYLLSASRDGDNWSFVLKSVAPNTEVAETQQ